jgi:ABC-2 type transport system ATP-binding protein
MAKFKSLRKLDYARDLVKRFKLDAKVKIKAMSKGMKQKLAIIIAFMNKPKVLILDEPTSGLDPLMQIEFDKLLLEARDGGATILISSHIFSEVEKVCDRATIIKDGKIIETLNISEILHSENKTYKFEFFDNETMNEAYKYLTLNKLNVNTSKASEKQLSVSFNDSKTNNFLKIIQYFKILYLKEIKNTLEKQFAKYYDDTDFNEQSTNENEQA